jgi:hypothetical protein
MSDHSGRLQERQRLFPSWHAFYFLAESSPVICLQFRVLDPLQAPVLVQTANVVLAVLEDDELVTDALLDENTSCVLLYNRFLVLEQ